MTAKRLNNLSYSLLFKYIIVTGFIAGSLDALSAIFILSHGNASSIFRFIASGLYGKDAFTAAGMVPLGVALHYIIAYSFTVFYFIVIKYLAFLHKKIFFSAIVYGLFVYMVMNVVVFSISNVNFSPRTVLSVTKNSAILIVCIALPIVYLNKIYRSEL